MVPEKYRLAAVGRFLIEQFELRRPGLKAWTPEAEASFRAQAETELQRMEAQLRELGIDDPAYWRSVRGALDGVLLPRYGAIAQKELALEQRDYGIWRGGDLLARGVFAVAGFAVGVFIVEVPYIPIYAKWFPAVTMIGGPLVPDAWAWLCRKRYQRRLQAIVDDLARAADRLDTYRPLSELTRSLQLDSSVAPPIPIRERG
jgi:hypothetical protein